MVAAKKFQSCQSKKSLPTANRIIFHKRQAFAAYIGLDFRYEWPGHSYGMTMLSRFLPLILLVAAISVALGVTLTLIQVDRLYFLVTSPSLIEVVSSLWAHEDRAIAVVTALFSIIFPALKLTVHHFAAFRSHESRIESPK